MASFSELQILAVANEQAREIARDYLEVVGETLVEYLQKRLGEKDVDSYGHSLEGQYPSRDTSSLQESINYQTYARGGKVFLKFGAMDDVRLFGKDTNPTLYARILEYALGRKLAHAAWEECRINGVVDEALRKAKHRRRYYLGDVGKFTHSPGPAKRNAGGLVKRDDYGRIQFEKNIPMSD